MPNDNIKTNNDKKIKRPKRRGKRTRLSNKGKLLIGAVAIILFVVIILVVASITKKAPAAPTIEGTDLTEAIPNAISGDSILGKDILEHIVRAGQMVEEACKKRPKTIELTDENKDTFVTIESCLISEDPSRVKVSISSEGVPKSDDKYYYVFGLDTFEDSLKEGAEPLAKSIKNETGTLDFALNNNSASSRLYQKFRIGVKVDDEFVLISSPSYITNPEAVSKYPNVFMNPGSKKGILVDYAKYKTGELQDLGVKQVAVNFRIEDFLGPSNNAFYSTIHYNYNGHTYSFNGAALSGFDETIKYLTEQGISVTAILLNSYSSAYISLIHPDSRSAGVCPYYMFNAATSDGVDYLAAIGSFFADRYSGVKHGRVSNWVIANEINARKEWNYMAYTDVDTYTQAYADGFRVLYNAIKSTSGSARVYISLDQQWDRNLANNPDYDGRDVLDCFNNYISSEGNIDWALAYHPYNVPLTTCTTWAASKYINHTADSSMISMQNIEVLVNYMTQPHFLEADGDHRSIMITELGYTSSGSGGESYQAAAIAYAFYKINYYDDIDGLLLNRETDDATEIAQGLATGITTTSGKHKMSYDVFKYMDTSEFESTSAFAKSIIGINNWSEIIYK